MATVHDVPAQPLLDRLAVQLKDDARAEPPEWVAMAKTGTHVEKAPVDRDWWYGRLAAVLRKVYVHGPIGSTRLAAEFGGKADRGSKPYHAARGSRAIARAALKKLEAMGLLTGTDGKGRVISPEGQKLLDDAAYAVLMDLAKEEPELTKYV